MYGTVVWIILIVVIIISLIWTLRIFKQEENKLKQYEEMGDTPESEMKRSEEYEQKSLKKHMPRLLWTYAIAIALSLIIFAIYLYY